MLQVEATTLVRAPQETVSQVYADYPSWPGLFRTISGVRLLIFPAMMTSPLHTMADTRDRLGGQGRRGFIQTQHGVDGRPAQRTWRRKRSSRRAARRSRCHSAATPLPPGDLNRPPCDLHVVLARKAHG